MMRDKACVGFLCFVLALASTGASAPPKRTIVFMGTSLTAGYGLRDPATEAYPAIVQNKIDSLGLPYQVVNAGVSGETSAGALARTRWVLRAPMSMLVLETGANDGLRGLPVVSLAAHIDSIIRLVRGVRPHVEIFLVQMEAPPNMGNAYTTAFHAVYPELARRDSVSLIPFLLEGVAGNRALNQADGMHPNAQGARRAAENVWRVLGPALEQTSSTTLLYHHILRTGD